MYEPSKFTPELLTWFYFLTQCRFFYLINRNQCFFEDGLEKIDDFVSFCIISELYVDVHLRRL